MFTFGEEIAAANENTAALGATFRLTKYFRYGSSAVRYPRYASRGILSSEIGKLSVLTLFHAVRAAIVGGFDLSEMRLYKSLCISCDGRSATTEIVSSAYWEDYYDGHLSLEVSLRLYENLGAVVQGIVPETGV